MARSHVEHRISSARSSVSRLQTKRRASLFWLEGRARQRTLEGLGQPAQLHCKATPQIDNRVSSCKPRVSVSKVQVLKRQGLQPMADPAGPLRGGSRRGAMCARIFLSQHQVLYQKIGLCGVSSCLQGPKWDEIRHFGRNMAEEGGTGAKPARGTRGPRIVPAARSVIAPYRQLGLSCCVAERRTPLERTGATHPHAAWGPTLPLGQPNLDSTRVSPS